MYSLVNVNQPTIYEISDENRIGETFRISTIEIDNINANAKIYQKYPVYRTNEIQSLNLLNINSHISCENLKLRSPKYINKYFLCESISKLEELFEKDLKSSLMKTMKIRNKLDAIIKLNK